MDRTIRKMAVVGAGTMGAAIAASGARAGLDVCMLVRPKGDVTGDIRAAMTLDTILKKGEMKGAGEDRIRAGVKCCDMDRDAEALRDCDLVIEAVAEDLEVKRSTIRYIFEHCGKDTVVGTNTSNISIASIAEGFPEEQKARFMGVHFFNPVRYMDLVELIPLPENAPAQTEKVRRLVNDRFGKTAVICRDAPGFIANRIGSMALTAAMNETVAFGYSFAKADALTGELMFRPKQGAFKLMDLVGLDIALHTVEYMATALVPEYEKPFRVCNPMIKTMVEHGLLGNKSGAGFYKKVKAGRSTERFMWDAKACDYVPLETVTVESLSGIKGKVERSRAMLFGELPESEYVRRVMLPPLWLSMCAAEDISHCYKDIDLAMRGGYNWERGPFEQCDALGAAAVLELMAKLGMEPPAWAKEKIAKDGAFYTAQDKTTFNYITALDPKYPTVLENDDAIVRDIGDGVACFTLKTKANTYTIKAAELLLEAEREIESAAAFKAMVVRNYGPNFGAGANLMDVMSAITGGQLDALEKGVECFQRANMGAKYLKKPLVSAAQGQALGGSAELLLHSGRVCTHQELYAGLVEVGVGLVPAGGGCAEMLFRATEGYEYGQMAFILAAIDKVVLPIAQAKFSMGAEDAFHNGYLRRGDLIVPKLDALLQQAKATALGLADGGWLPPVKGTVTASGENGYAHLMAVVHTMSAGNMMTPYDCVVVEKLARIFSGGDALSGEQICEEDVLALERKCFMELCREEKTLERIKGMVTTGKPVRN